MVQEIDLLNQVQQNADMGQDSTRHILELSNDANFLHTLEKQMEGYQKNWDEACGLIRQYHQEPTPAKTFSKLMSHISSDLKTINDSSTSKLAEMMIQGTTMGVTNLSKQIHAYEGSDNQVLSLAKKQLEMEEQNIEALKAFL